MFEQNVISRLGINIIRLCAIIIINHEGQGIFFRSVPGNRRERPNGV